MQEAERPPAKGYTMNKILISGKLLGDLSTFLALALLLISIIALVGTQLGYLWNSSPSMPFYEPDNYEYLLFAQLAIAHPGVAIGNITNPYLIGAPRGFFEAPGLLLMPVYLHYALPFLSLVEVFRLLQLIAVITIYGMTLLIAREILKHTFLNKRYTYIVYGLILLNFTLMQYTEILEYRGNEFITAILLVCFYLLVKVVQERKLWAPFLGLLAGISLFVWSGGFVVPVSLGLLIVMFVIYRLILRNSPYLWKWIALLIVIGSILLFFFAVPVESFIMGITSRFGYTGCSGSTSSLMLGETQCLDNGNGLLVVLLSFIFGTFALLGLLGPAPFSYEKHAYEYMLFGVFAMSLILLPLALIYLRLLSILAPFITLLYSLGVVCMLALFNKAGSNRLIQALTLLLMFLSWIAGMYLFYQSSILLYHLSNPSGLVGVASYLSTDKNSTVFAYYGYGDYLEAYGHVHVYMDTIQGLGAATNLSAAFSGTPSSLCTTLHSLQPRAEFVLVGGSMDNSSLYYNASALSFVKNPMGFNGVCGYSLVYQKEGFWLFRIS